MNAGTALFLFAHQDDEFGVFQKILDERAAGVRVVCAFMTTGTVGGASPEARNRESLAVLTKLGVSEGDVVFVGQQLKIDDGALMHRLADAAAWLHNWIAACPSLRGLYLPAWEGGHPDHDSLHAVGVTVARQAGLLGIAKQSSLYNGYKRPGQLFNVMRPLPMNGPVEPVAVPWKHRIAFMRHCLSYPSQRKTWIGLFPFVLLHYVFGGRDAMQPVAPERLASRPHEGPLYYERRQFTTWSELSRRVNEYMGAEA
jgi:LmbE family N-acetylglucosaminyl deacetylase